jgi:hypothetical protein
LLRLRLLRSHLEQGLRIHAACGACHIHSHEARHGSAGISRCGTHSVALGADNRSRRHSRVAHNRRSLKLFDSVFIFL